MDTIPVIYRIKRTAFVKTDQWRDDFLKEIENSYQLEILAENESYRLISMPFYNESTKTNFINIFNEKLKLQ